MKLTRKRLVQVIVIFITHAITLFVLQRFWTGFNVNSLRALAVVTIVLGFAQSASWYVFINFFSWMPGWLFPIFTFFVNGLLIMRLGNLVSGVKSTPSVPPSGSPYGSRLLTPLSATLFPWMRTNASTAM